MTEGASDPSPADGKSVTVTATLSNSNTYDHDKTVAVSVGGTGTATSGTDYNAVSNFNIKISAGQKSGTATFDLKSTDDSVYEGSETIGVAGTSTGLTVNSATLTLADNDSAAVTVNDASADEGDDLTFTVTLDTAVQGGLTVTPGFTDGTAVEGTDYDENTAALSFDGTAGETETFTVSSTEDLIIENDETFTVGLAVSDAPSGITATDTGTGTIEDDETGPGGGPLAGYDKRGGGRRRDDRDGHGDAVHVGALPGGPEGDGVGWFERRHGGLRDGLRGGDGFRHHHRQGRGQRHGDLLP